MLTKSYLTDMPAPASDAFTPRGVSGSLFSQKRLGECVMTTWGNAASKLKSAYAVGLLILLVGIAPAHPAAAGEGNASGFVAGLGSQAIQIMKDAELSAADRLERFGALMNENFNLPKIARIVLGRYWEGTSDIERQQFTNAFADYTARIYSTRFADYSGESFRVIKQRAESETMTVVNTEITRLAGGQSIKVDWSVEKTPAGYKVTDISAGGASLARAQREEFSSAVQRSGGSVSNLIQQLRTKVSELATSAH
jgi:phospholipid transport system substrate-binding protein